jgi:hypothetical protein
MYERRGYPLSWGIYSWTFESRREVIDCYYTMIDTLALGKARASG